MTPVSNYEGDCAHVLALDSLERNRAVSMIYSSFNPMMEDVGISYQRIPGFLSILTLLLGFVSIMGVYREFYTSTPILPYLWSFGSLFGATYRLLRNPEAEGKLVQLSDENKPRHGTVARYLEATSADSRS